MQITIELPKDIAVGLESKWKDLPRAALESLALEAGKNLRIVPSLFDRHPSVSRQKFWQSARMVRSEVLNDGKSDTGVGRHQLENFSKASSPPAEAPNATIGKTLV